MYDDDDDVWYTVPCLMYDDNSLVKTYKEWKRESEKERQICADQSK